YEKLAAQYGLASPKALYASATGPGPAVAQIASDPSASLAVSGPTQTAAVPVGTEDQRARGLTTQGLSEVATPTPISFDQSGVNKLIDYQIKDRNDRYNEQQANIAEAYKTLYQNLDATDEEKAAARAIVQSPKIAPAFGYKS